MAGDPARNAYADRRDLLEAPDRVIDPRARQPLETSSDHAEVRTRVNHHRFEITDVAMDVLTIGLEVDDRIADQLARAVIRDVTATTGLEHGHAQFVEAFRCGEDVGPAAALADAEGEHMWVLEQEQRVRNVAGLALLHERTLHLQRFVIGHTAEATNVERPQITPVTDRTVRSPS
jgi:hypothetical protein